MIVRRSDITEYAHVSYWDGDPAPVHATDLFFNFRGERYGTRVQGFLHPGQVDMEEERFLERRHAKPRPTRPNLGVVQ